MSKPLVYVPRSLLDIYSQTLKQGDIHYGAAAVALDGESVFHFFDSEPERVYGQRWAALALHAAAPLARQYVPREALLLTVYQGNARAYLYHRDVDEPIEAEVHLIPDASEITSRSTGLLETTVLAQKHVMIVGLGSGGSQIALELAKAGIGQFTLVDFDRIDLSNVARHVAGVNDLGRLKTNVMREAILQKNPSAQINTFNHDVDSHLPYIADALKGVDLLIAATDNNRSRFNLNALALEKRIPMLVGRATTRAAGGDVLRVRPYEGPCYACLFGAGLLGQEERSSIRQLRPQTPAYVSDADVQATIQVGLASDIAPIANMVVKLALVELSRGLESGLKSLETDLAADFYLWGNRREDIFVKWPPLGYGFQQNTILRWYGVRATRNPTCPACGEQTQKTVEGEDFFGGE